MRIAEFREHAAKRLTDPRDLRDVKLSTRAWRVYGAPGHRIKESFAKSYGYDFSKGDQVRLIQVHCSDINHSNEYVTVIITRNTWEECEEELWTQISDGIFENQRTGKIEEYPW